MCACTYVYGQVLATDLGLSNLPERAREVVDEASEAGSQESVAQSSPIKASDEHRQQLLQQRKAAKAVRMRRARREAREKHLIASVEEAEQRLAREASRRQSRQEVRGHNDTDTYLA